MGREKKGKPRRVRDDITAEEATRIANENPMYWQEFRHGCGCYLSWGIPVRGTDMATHANAQAQMFQFFDTIKVYPCPLHGSATGVPSAPLKEGERRYMPASNVYYRECPEDRRVYADRVAEHLGVPDLGHSFPQSS